MKKRIFAPLALMLFVVLSSTCLLYSQDIPEKPSPPRLVNDFAHLLNGNEISALESKLVAFNDSSSTQIAVVIVKDLANYEIEEYAQRLGERWGIGQKGMNNGLVIVVKAKTESSKGEVFIKAGYGLEGAVPDLTCSSIVDNEILPAFRDGDYYKGLDKATSVIISLVRGEFTAAQYGSKSPKNIKKAAPAGLFVVIFIIAMFLISAGKSNHNNISRRGGLPFWLLLSMMNSGRNASSGSWGGFSGGGGGGGGFGGFGGGSFGGGGAGGSW
ncbi:MAG: TPM domain-containing protein [Bacteroidales bacterium]